VDSDEDRGSTPLASSLRSRRSGEHRLSRRSLGEGGRYRIYKANVASYDSACPQMAGFVYIYVLQSLADPARFYTGCAHDLRKRILRHNKGCVRHTAKWKPWRLKTYIALSDERRAREFERYLKSSSGRAFLKKRL